MARAQRVPGIRPKQSLLVNGRRVVAVRLDELLSLRASLDDSSLVAELHDMRIAAKRLRYALEMFDVCFPVKPVLKQLTEMQEDLGDIHDLDVLVGILRGRLATIDAADEESTVELMSEKATPTEKNARLRRLLVAQARNPIRLGLVGLIGDKVAERRRRFTQFQDRWRGDSLDAFALKVRQVARIEQEVLPPDSSMPNVAPQALSESPDSQLAEQPAVGRV